MGRIRMQPEHKLQSQCVLWFSQQFPERRGKLWANFSEQSAMEASQKLSLGLVKALPDLMYLEWGELIGVELKAQGSRHNVKHLREQCQWLIKFPAAGCFCDSLSMFQSIIIGGAFHGISPYLVHERLVRATASSVDWDKLVEGL